LDKDIDNIFHFEEEAPTPAKRKRSEDTNEVTTTDNCKRVDLKKSPSNAVNPGNSSLKVVDETKSLTEECQNLTLSRSMVVEQTVSRNSKSIISPSQFLCKRKMKLDEAERSKVLGDIPQNELSRSFVRIEKKSLVVERGRKSNQQEQHTVNKNVKKFRKQRLVKSSMSIIRVTNSSSVCTIDTNKREIVTPVEEPVLFAQVQQQENDMDENLWNFEQSQSMM